MSDFTLEKVNKAIANILEGGQSYSIAGRSLTRADLSMLYKLRNDLMAQENVSGDSELFGDTYVAQFGGR